MDLSRDIDPPTDSETDAPGSLPDDVIDRAERMATIRAVEEGLDSMKRGEGRPMDEVFEELEASLRRAASRP